MSEMLTKTFAKIGLLVDVNLRRQNVAERRKQLSQIIVSELLW